MSNKPGLDLVIAGGGTAGWMAAALLSRFLEDTARITLVESEDIGTVGVGEATIPQIHAFNVALGLDEREFVRATNASYKLGIEFAGWLRPGHSYMHAFGTVGRGSGLIPFRHLWLRAKELGVAEDLGCYSFNEVAARLGRMARPSGKPGPFPDLAYAYHFDASLYAAYLRRYAQARGVHRVEGLIEAVDRDGLSGDIIALRLNKERRVAGSFFLDCTGFRSLLLGGALGVGFQDWSNFLPCDRALAVPCARSEAFRPYTQSLARQAGWQWRIPLQHRTGNGHVYCSRFISDDEAAAVLLSNLDGEAQGEPRPIRFTAGRRDQMWSHNCVALGLAAGFMEPLESTSIHLSQSSLARLIKLLPAAPAGAQTRSAFNRLTAMEWEQIRDFLVLHYRANQRVGEAFWDHCRELPMSESLAAKIALYEESGGIVREDGELFTEEAWSQVMAGQGLQAGSYSPLARTVDRDDLAAYLAKLTEGYRRKAETLPSHAQFVEAAAGKAAVPMTAAV